MRRGRLSNLDCLGISSRNLDAIFPPADLNLAKFRFASTASVAFVVLVLSIRIRVRVWRVLEWRFLLNISALASGFFMPAAVLFGIRKGAFVFRGWSCQSACSFTRWYVAWMSNWSLSFMLCWMCLAISGEWVFSAGIDLLIDPRYEIGAVVVRR